MLLADGALGVVLMLLWVFCILDSITADASRVRNLPKGAWIAIVIVLLDVGSLLWLVAGRPQGAARASAETSRRAIPPEYDKPGRAVAQNPDDDEAFLAQVRERAEEQRRKAAEQARRLREEEDGAQT